MKKIIVMLLAVVLVLSAVACTQQPKVLKDETHELWVAHGQYLLADGTQNSWGGKEASLYEKSALKAIALEDVKAISEDLYNALSKKAVKYLYTIDLIFGTNDATWDCKFVKDGKVYKANGSYAVKIAQCNSEVDGDTKVYSEAQWISDPHTAYVEALTPATIFYPVWQEEKDENGFSWADNPVVIGGAGLYTLVVAQYTNASAAGQPGFGVGLVLKEAKDGIAYEEIKTFVPGDHTYGIVGSFEASGWADGKDVAMTADGANKWVGEVELKANDELKVRADGKWDNSWGTSDGGNIKVEADGTYVVTIEFSGETGTVTVTAK
ncbi:MAG: SusF/SusE family outer membrane protein [Clostridia bacterium]|nr:SusF/SusE family outer membrane protein [Clostridia bacterium]